MRAAIAREYPFDHRKQRSFPKNKNKKTEAQKENHMVTMGNMGAETGKLMVGGQPRLKEAVGPMMAQLRLTRAAITHIIITGHRQTPRGNLTNERSKF